MKKRILFVIICFVLLLSLIVFSKDEKKSDKNTIKVAEVTHSIFYTPWYVALNNGYFEEEGLDVNVILTPGADKVISSVISGDAEIGLSGPEATIYNLENGNKDKIISFAGLTKRDGQFIFGDCKYKDNFQLVYLENKHILVGRKAGMPEMMFSYALYNNGINSNKINVDTSIEFSALSGSYISGIGDFVNLFEPNASTLEKNGYGCVLSSLGKYVGDVPYTAFNTKEEYYLNNKDIIDKFRRALNKGIEFTLNNDDEVIANVIIKSFPDESINSLTAMIKRYRENDAWYSNTEIKKDAWMKLESVMKYNGVIKNSDYFDILVKND